MSCVMRDMYCYDVSIGGKAKQQGSLGNALVDERAEKECQRAKICNR